MSAVLAWARLDLRRRWLSTLVLVVLVALSASVLLATLAGARRTDTVIPRLDKRSLPADVMVLPNKAGFDWSKVRHLPSVESLGTFVLTEASPEGVGFSVDQVEGFPAGDRVENVAVDRPALISGRLPDPNSPDEIIASPGFVEKYGRTVTIRFPSRAQTKGLPHGRALPPGLHDAGAVAHLHVVGVGVNTFNLGPGGGPVFVPTYAFFTHYVKGVLPYFENARVRLRGGEAAIPEFQKELAAATGNPDIQVDDWHENVKTLQRTASYNAIGWVLFCGIAFLASLVLVGQAFVRFSVAAGDDLRTMAALGMARRQATAAAAVGPAVATVAGLAIAIGAAVGVSALFPTGLIGRYEPVPGVSADVAVLGGAGGVLLLVAWCGAWLSGRAAVMRAAEPTDRPSLIATAARRAGLGVSAVLGARFALEPGRGKTRVPVRPALVGAVAGVLGVVGAFTFRSGLNGTVNDPLRFGQTFGYIGFVSEGGPPPSYAAVLREAARDGDIADLEDMRVASLPINGRTTSAVSITPVLGHVPIVTLDGRAPASSSEVAIGPTTAHDLGVGIGSTVTVAARRMTVTGIAFAPENPHNGYTDGAWLTTAGFARAQPDKSRDKFHEVRLNFRPGVDGSAAVRRLPKALAPGGIGPADEVFPVDEQIELKSLTAQPLLLGGFLIILAIAAVGHGLATAVRRRRHDVAVLRSVGLTRRQTRLVIVTQATVLAAFGLVLGIPLGIASGRTAWRVVADAMPVYYVAPLAVLAVVIAIPAAVAVANTLAALPARRAARLRVGEILRTE